MGTRYISTTEITAQVHAAWCCEKCNSVNHSYGCIYCKGTGTAYGIHNREVAASQASSNANFNFFSAAYSLLTNPTLHPGDLRKNLSISDPYCQKCRKKAVWTYGRWPFVWTVIACVIAAFISIIGVLDEPTEISCWVVLASSFVIAVPTLIIDLKINTKIYNLPKQYCPEIRLEPKKDQAYKNESAVDAPIQPTHQPTNFETHDNDSSIDAPTDKRYPHASDAPCEKCRTETDVFDYYIYHSESHKSRHSFCPKCYNEQLNSGVNIRPT